MAIDYHNACNVRFEQIRDYIEPEAIPRPVGYSRVAFNIGQERLVLTHDQIRALSIATQCKVVGAIEYLPEISKIIG